MTPPTVPPTARPGSPPPAKAAAATTKSVRKRLAPRQVQDLAPRLIVYGVEGFGKTTLAAYAPDPLILMSRQETGYDTLLSRGLVPAVPAERVDSWPDLLDWLDDLIADSQGRKTLVLDAMGGFERLCQEYTCERHFKNDWSETGFAGYQKGYDASLTEWLTMLARLDQLHRQGIVVLITGHARVATFKNPQGPDYDRFCVDCHWKIWSATYRWVDAALFGNFLTIYDKKTEAESRGRGKASKGGTDRILFTERRDAYDAKNQYGLPPEIWLTKQPSESWSTLWQHLQRKEPASA